MELDLYFQPLESFEIQENTIGSKSDIYFKEFPDWESSDIVLLSVNEKRGDLDFKQGDFDHYSIRHKFYRFKWDGKTSIADLGVLQAGAEIRDTYLALKEITSSVQKKQKFLIVIGGTQDLSYANYLGYEDLEQTVNLTCIDRCFDVAIEKEDDINKDNFINHLLLHHPSILFNFSILGFQKYYVGSNQFRFFDDLYFDYMRLGELNSSIEKAEPILRNSDILSIDLSAFRNADFKSSIGSGPNGFLPMKCVN